ncbi:Stress responsive A/B Barrel Domain [Arachidicoccus rhizosphaerae]|uniref:Stress responsive A/B Barrel Domain n=1 Tax=Arachidicoccus rhizosphaerae TaxID=551991 RepID=A0A1H3YXJ8_9BACT|nr:Dabb family protein [Arachidicoccus rhizosphaerae]SEA16186.1 Stress responsive A/B Barrel Domain [Arachidicoccus rhizosphaerae]
MSKFVHVVNFWLKKELDATGRAAFVKGVNSLGQIKNLAAFHVGEPAPTDRPVIDRSYDYALVCTFENQEDHDLYQTDPIHDAFRDNCAQYWDKVLIYDSIGIE